MPVAIAALLTSELLPVSGNELAATDVLAGVLALLLGQVLAVPQLGLLELGLLLEEAGVVAWPQLAPIVTFEPFSFVAFPVAT